MNNLTLLLHTPQADAEAMLALLQQGWESKESLTPESRQVDIPVIYGGEQGPDLDEVARHTGMTPRQVVECHAAAAYVVYFLGFQPGFSYLGGMPEQLATPRRAEPRLAVAAGSVGIGGGQTGIYPLVTPGGWQLIGRTPLALFNPHEMPPTLLRRAITCASCRRRRAYADYSACRHLYHGAGFGPRGIPTPGHQHRRGAGSTGVEDRQPAGGQCAGGRRAGDHPRPVQRRVYPPWLDRPDRRRLRRAAGRQAAVDRLALPGEKGQRLALGTPKRGMRSYLAISGGIAVPEMLGSCSTDMKAAFGGHEGRNLKDGDRLPLGKSHALPQHRCGVKQLLFTNRIRALPGPEYAEFSEEAQDTFWRTAWQLSPQSNRMGYRLHGGTPLERTTDREMLSHGLLPGVVQVPHNGQPIVLMADAQTTGGYPRIACVIEADLYHLAQIRLGEPIHFVLCSLTEAQRAKAEQDLFLRQIAWGLHDR